MKKISSFLTVLVLALWGCGPDEPTYLNWKIYNKSNSTLSSDSISNVAIGHSGKVWVVTGRASGVIHTFDGVEWDNVVVPDAMRCRINDIQIDQTGRLWVCCTEDTVLLFGGEQWEQFIYPDIDIRDFQVGNASNEFWLATRSGLIQYNGSAWQAFTMNNSGLLTNELACLAKDVDGSIWVGSHRDPMSSAGEDGLFRYDGTEWTIYNTDNSELPNNRIRDIVIGNDGVKWIFSQDIVRFHNSDWKIFNGMNEPALTNKTLINFFVDRGNSLWLNVWQGGLIRNDANVWNMYHKGNSGLPSNVINDIDSDHQNNIYIATDKGLAIYTLE